MHKNKLLLLSVMYNHVVKTAVSIVSRSLCSLNVRLESVNLSSKIVNLVGKSLNVSF